MIILHILTRIHIKSTFVNTVNKIKCQKMPKIYCIKSNLNSNILYDYITHINTYTYEMKQNETKKCQIFIITY